jgi:hypothetical protein
MNREAYCRKKSLCHLIAIHLVRVRITMKGLDSLPTWSRPTVSHKYIPHCSCFILFRIVTVWSARYRNENKLVYAVCYTCDNTVTPVYANPFTHESPNALSCLFMVLEQKKKPVLKL